MNVAVLVAYALAVALLLTASGSLLERALSSVRLPVRWVWLGVLILSAGLPLVSVVSALRTVAEPAPSVRPPAVVSIAATDVGEPRVVESGSVDGWTFGSLLEWRHGLNEGLARGAALLPEAPLSEVWVAGAWAVMSLLVALLLTWSVLRLERRSLRRPAETLLGREVNISPELGPATVGLLNPRIVLPNWAKDLPRADLELVLRHEGEHVRSRDPLLLAMGLLAVVACPWNPLVWWQMRRLKAAVEVDCDRRVLRDGVAPAPYGHLLLRLGTRGRLGSLAVPTIVGSTSLLERRLTMMKNARHQTPVSPALAASGIAVLLGIVACTAEAPVAANAEAELAATPAAQAESERRSDDVIHIWVDRDGTVQVEGTVHPVDQVEDAVAPLRSPESVVSIEAHAAVPYRVVADVQNELRAAGLLRVAFTAVETAADRPPTRDLPNLRDEGLTMVLPDSSRPRISSMDVNPRNLMLLDVRPTGRVEVRRGASPEVQEIAAAEVESVVRQGLAENPSLIAVMRTDADAEYRHMYAVLDAVQRAELTRFALEVAG